MFKEIQPDEMSNTDQLERQVIRAARMAHYVMAATVIAVCAGATTAIWAVWRLVSHFAG